MIEEDYSSPPEREPLLTDGQYYEGSVRGESVVFQYHQAKFIDNDPLGQAEAISVGYDFYYNGKDPEFAEAVLSVLEG